MDMKKIMTMANGFNGRNSVVDETNAEANSKNVKCLFCDSYFGFDCMENFWNHMQHEHYIRIGFYEFMCYVCSRKFLRALEFDMHLLTFHAGAGGSASAMPTYRCLFCSSIYSSGHDLKIHVKSMHFDMVRDVYVECRVCGVFAKRGNFREHIRKHVMEFHEYEKDKNTRKQVHGQQNRIVHRLKEKHNTPKPMYSVTSVAATKVSKVAEGGNPDGNRSTPLMDLSMDTPIKPLNDQVGLETSKSVRRVSKFEGSLNNKDYATKNSFDTQYCQVREPPNMHFSHKELQSATILYNYNLTCKNCLYTKTTNGHSLEWVLEMPPFTTKVAGTILPSHMYIIRH